MTELNPNKISPTERLTVKAIFVLIAAGLAIAFAIAPHVLTLMGYMRSHIPAEEVSRQSMTVVLPAKPVMAFNKIQVAFRFDDYSEVSDLDMDSHIFRAFADLDIPLSIGVIPYAVKDGRNKERQQEHQLSLYRANLLDQMLMHSKYQITLHGCTHQTVNPRTYSLQSEFAGVHEAAQWDKIRRGKEQLEQLFPYPITCFVPPWETYDRNTLKVLEEFGFQSISAQGIDYPTSLQVVPSTCGIRNLKRAVEQMRQDGTINRAVFPQPIVCLFHAYDFKESVNPLWETLAWVKDQPDIQPVLLQDVCDQHADCHRAWEYAKLKKLETALWPVWERPLYYPPLSVSNEIGVKTKAAAVAAIALSCVPAMFLVSWILRWMKADKHKVMVLGIASVTVLAAVSVGVFTAKDLAIVSVAIGCLMGCIKYQFVDRKRERTYQTTGTLATS